jgi:carbamoyl-phosphate synthase small subunit
MGKKRMRKAAWLTLENGIVFEGRAFGAIDKDGGGEVVFNTAMSGYQEVLTDPSYRRQIVTFTCPHIGNVGVNHFDEESDRIQVAGIVVRECSPAHSNWRSERSLDDYLKQHGVIGIEGIDTRRLTRILRSEGAMRGYITTRRQSESAMQANAQQVRDMHGLDLTGEVTADEAYNFVLNADEPLLCEVPEFDRSETFKVAAFDFGIKRNILRRLTLLGCDVRVFPAKTSAEEILAWGPDGVFLSNGPGDPAAVTYAFAVVRRLAEQLPMFGICLGHQLIALAFGAKTYKLKFGHRGLNHPVQQQDGGAVEITSQNHGFSVEEASLPEELELTHVNINDHTVAGLRHKEFDLMCVQYHPEAAPGTHDSDYLFARFRQAMAVRRAAAASA